MKSLLWKIPAALLASVLGLISLTEFSPIYDFPQSQPFRGQYIYNPYSSLDTANTWKRVNFHTHTKVDGLFNECDYYPDSVAAFYDRYGYDLVTFSNHMEITDPGFRIYEHGVNFAKLHNLVVNPSRVHCIDCALPFLVSQQQFKINRINKDCDFVFLNHPDRTFFIDDESMSKLGGYRVMEAVCGFDNKHTYSNKWDLALSSGHYVTSAISDDLHKPDRSSKIARRASFLSINDTSLESVEKCLLGGCFYSMFIPDFGDGNIEEKIKANRKLPKLNNIGLRADMPIVFINLSIPADTIQVISDNGLIISECNNVDSYEFSFPASASYLRFVARFPVMSNAFARSGNPDNIPPYRENDLHIKPLLTVLFNLLVAAFAALMFYLVCLIFKRKNN